VHRQPLSRLAAPSQEEQNRCPPPPRPPSPARFFQVQGSRFRPRRKAFGLRQAPSRPVSLSSSARIWRRGRRNPQGLRPNLAPPSPLRLDRSRASLLRALSCRPAPIS